MPRFFLFFALFLFVFTLTCAADCPLDHFKIACNPDGILGNDDDDRLFFDCTHLYRHSDPDDPPQDYKNRFYPLYYNTRYQRYQIGEPGFDLQTADPNRQLTGSPDTDFRLVVQVLDLSPDLTAVSTDVSPTLILDEPNDSFVHSDLDDPHIHFQYRCPDPAGADTLQWITFRVIDTLDDGSSYLPSDPATVVFVRAPLPGDIHVDNLVDARDLHHLTRAWLAPDADLLNDFHHRADINRDHLVNLLDFRTLLAHWLQNLP